MKGEVLKREGREGRRIGLTWGILLGLVGVMYAFGYELTAGGLIFFGGLFAVSLTLSWLRNRTVDEETRPLPPGDWLTADEAAKLTGAPLDQFLNLVAREAIPYESVGRGWLARHEPENMRFRREDVARVIEG